MAIKSSPRMFLLLNPTNKKGFKMTFFCGSTWRSNRRCGFIKVFSSAFLQYFIRGGRQSPALESNDTATYINFKQIMQHAKDEDFYPVNNKDMAIYTWINKTPCLEFCKIMFLKSNDGFIFKSMLIKLVSATDEAGTHIHFLTDEAGYIMFATDEVELFCFYDLICISRLIDAWNPSISSMTTLLFSIDRFASFMPWRHKSWVR